MKKIVLLYLFLFQLTFVFGQSVGSVVRSKTIYSGSGIDISYTITYYGNGDCNNKPNAYYKKYKLDFSASNTSSSTVSLYGSRIDLDDNLNHFQDNCRTAAAILLGAYPGFEQFGILEPNERRTATMYAYMLSSANDLPYVAYSIIPKIQKKEQTKNTPQSNQQNSAPTDNKTYNSIQDAITKFNSLITQAATVDQQTATRIQNDIQNALNSKGNTETFKLTIVNNGIRDLENLMARKNTYSTNQPNNSKQQPTQQNDLTEYNRSKADLERQMAEKNAEIQRQNLENANKLNIWNNAIKAGVDAHNSGNYTEAKNQFSIAINNSTNEQNRQNAQNYYNKSVDAEKSKVKIKAIGDFANATTDFLKVLNNRKRANKSALSSEDAQVLLGIVNSETPFDYAQNIIDIFSDLGYTYKSTDKLSYGGMYISMFDNSTIQWPLSIVIDPASKYDPYNKIKFSYQRKEKLYNQLLSLGDNLVGFSIKGISPTRKKEEEQKNTEKEQKILVEEQKKKEIAEKFAEIIPLKSSKRVDTNVTIESIIKKYIIARGGEEKLKAVKTITILTETEKFSMKMTMTHGKVINIGTYNDGNNFKIVFNGTTGYSEFFGKKSILDNDEIAFYKTSQPIEQVFRAQNNAALNLGEFIENFKGRDCYAITENSKFRNVSLINKQYFDIVSGLWVGTETIATAPNYNNTSYVYYDDYRSIGGILFPFSMVRIDEKSLTKTITTEVKLNVNISDSDFQ